MTASADALLTSLFGDDVLSLPLTEAAARIHATHFGRAELRRIHDFLAAQSVELGDESLPAVMHLPVKGATETLGLMAMLHGNEPAGLAAIAMAIAFWRRGELTGNVYCILGTPLASAQYFDAWDKAPDARQETRDFFRRGYGEDGKLLRDPNRIPPDYREDKDNPHNARAIALEALADRFTATLDIHSARGELICVTECTEMAHLKNQPIRNVLGELAGSIGSHSAAVTFKTLLLKKPEIKALTGIEAGRHEDPEAPNRAAAFTHGLMFNLDITSVPPLPDYLKHENGVFHFYDVGSSLPFSGLLSAEGTRVQDGDVLYTVMPSTLEQAKKAASENVLLRDGGTLRVKATAVVTAEEAASVAYREHQFEELEEIRQGQVVVAAVPSGALLAAPSTFSGIFVAKRSALYEDKAAGVLPLPASEMEQKFCFPCTRKIVSVD